MPATKTTKEKDQPALTFEWGTFCRQVLQDPSNRENSLIGLMPGLSIGIKSDQPEVELPAIIWAHAVFKNTWVIDETVPVTLTARIAQTRRDPVIKEFDLEIKPNTTHTSLNIQIMMNEPGATLLLAEGKQSLKVSFRLKKVDLGTINLPISVTRVDETQEPKNGG